MEMRSYSDMVRSAAAARSGEPIFNGSADHAAVIIEELFSSAISEVRLVTGDLSALVYGRTPLVQRAKQFLGHSSHKLTVIVETMDVSPTHPFMQAVAGNANVSFRKLYDDASAKMPYHFMTADNDCFRFEKIKNSHTAVAAFGDEKTTTHLNELFDILVNLSEEVVQPTITPPAMAL